MTDPDWLRRYVETDVRHRLSLDLAEALWGHAVPDEWFGGTGVCKAVVVEAARAVGGETESFVLAAQRDGLSSERLGAFDEAFRCRPVRAQVHVSWPDETLVT